MGILCGAYCCARKEDWLVFNWVCMILLLEKSIHVITGIVSAVVAIRSGSKPGTGTKFRKGGEIRASPRFGLGKKKRAPSRLVAGGERLGSCLEIRLSAAEPCSAAIRSEEHTSELQSLRHL